MNNYIIIEDDNYTVDKINDIVANNFPSIIFSGGAPSIVDAIELIKTSQPNFIFLDVNLEDGESFDILKKFPNPNFKIIFVTSYSKYAVEAFKFSALDFVLKPFTSDEIVSAVEKVVVYQSNKDYSKRLDTFFHNYTSAQKKIILSNVDSIHIILIEDILYAESDNSYTTFYIIDGREILVSKSLKSFEEKLSNYFFFRSHQKYLINLHHITKYNKRSDEIVLLNTTCLPVSQLKKQKLLQILKQ